MMLEKNMLFISEETMVEIVEQYYKTFFSEEEVVVTSITQVLHDRDGEEEGKYFGVILQGQQVTLTVGESDERT